MAFIISLTLGLITAIKSFLVISTESLSLPKASTSIIESECSNSSINCPFIILILSESKIDKENIREISVVIIFPPKGIIFVYKIAPL